MTANSTEIPESEATGEIGALYDDLRRVTGVGMVNLIYRRMAGVPGLLDWCWGVIRPLFVSGAAPGAADSLRAALDWPQPAPIPEAALRLVGVDAAAEATIRRTLDAYNHANRCNLFALSALARFLEAGAARAATGADGPSPSAGAAPEALPPILAITDMTPEAAALVRVLSRPVVPPNKPLIPSLYRHLAHWPGFLALAAPAIMQALDSGIVADLSSRAKARARAVADEMAAGLANPPGLAPPDAAVRAEWLDTLRAYTAKPIPDMIVVGRIIRLSLPPD